MKNEVIESALAKEKQLETLEKAADAITEVALQGLDASVAANNAAVKLCKIEITGGLTFSKWVTGMKPGDIKAQGKLIGEVLTPVAATRFGNPDNWSTEQKDTYATFFASVKRAHKRISGYKSPDRKLTEQQAVRSLVSAIGVLNEKFQWTEERFREELPELFESAVAERIAREA